jgi:ornithine cyclodeaminase
MEVGPVLAISAQVQEKLVTMQEAIEGVAVALSEYSCGRTQSPVRLAIPVGQGEAGQKGVSLFMPSYVEAAGSLGIKMVSVFPGNKQSGRQTIYGLLLLADPATGEPLAVLEASRLTVLRTGAAAGLATRLLARETAAELAVIGTGAQARGAVEAVLAVRPIKRIRLYNRTKEKAASFAREIAALLGPGHPELTIVDAADEAVKNADIIVTATNSAAPVFSAEALSPGVHVNAIGSFRPDMQELPGGLIAAADKVAVESREAALEETGDLLIPIRQGLFQPERIHAELGEIAAGLKPGREREGEITVFKSVGLAAMDMVIARLLYDRAVETGAGQLVSLI